MAVGQTGRVALAAMPDRQIPFTVTRIVPLAQVQEGKTVFRLEASLTPGESATLRPGMEGGAHRHRRAPLRLDLDPWLHGLAAPEVVGLVRVGSGT